MPSAFLNPVYTFNGGRPEAKEDLCGFFHSSQFPSLGVNGHSGARGGCWRRSAIAAAIVDDEFLADCLSWELGLLEVFDSPRRGLVPFFTVPDLGIRFAFGYWPPGETPGPHEHTAWTITAVCRNKLEVLTYDRESRIDRGSSYRRTASRLRRDVWGTFTTHLFTAQRM